MYKVMNWRGFVLIVVIILIIFLPLYFHIKGMLNTQEEKRTAGNIQLSQQEELNQKLQLKLARYDDNDYIADVAIRKVKNGSILLFHARHADYMCLEAILPELGERGYEMVTISEMLGLPPLEPQEGLFDWAQYKKTHLM